MNTAKMITAYQKESKTQFWKKNKDQTFLTQFKVKKGNNHEAISIHLSMVIRGINRMDSMALAKEMLTSLRETSRGLRNCLQNCSNNGKEAAEELETALALLVEKFSTDTMPIQCFSAKPRS